MLIALLVVSAAQLGTAGDSCRAAPDCESGLTCRHQTCVPRARAAGADKRVVAEPAPAPTAPPPQTQPTYAPPPAHYGAPERWQEGDPVPPGMHVEDRRLKPLWVAGLVIDLSVWAIRATITAAICAGTKCDAPTVGGAFVPVIGAWIQLPNTSDPVEAAAIVLSGVVETTGFIMLVCGAAIHRDVLAYDAGPLTLRFAPLPLAHGSGAALLASF